jgi:hypothetical protein
MKIFNTLHFSPWNLWVVILFFLSGCATSAGGHEEAKILSAQITLVAEEGKRFADARDVLAKARLRNMQNLENSLIETEEENSLDLTAWHIIGAKFRATLYEGVLAATKEASDQHKQQIERREQQAKELAERKSAVAFQRAELIATAQNLSTIAEKPSADENRARLFSFTKNILTQLSKDSSEGKSKIDSGNKLIEEVEKNLVNQSKDDVDFKDKKELDKKKADN